MWNFVIIYLCMASAWCDSKNHDEDIREVRIAQGTVLGRRNQKYGVFVFYNIPYATVPVGSHRYKAPLPGPTWQEPIGEVNKKIICPQVESFVVGDLATRKMQENCLIATIYVPNTKKNDLPVVVYVHGGAFQVGFGDMLPPANIVKNKNVVAVTFNYRLGVTGFLCLGTKDVPGNAGLKDQVALLRWVKINIASFGGNPDDVTIVGASAGSVSVELLMLSNITGGLFNKVIPESGASVGAIALQFDPIENAKNIALQLGYTDDVDDIYALEHFYSDTPQELMVKKIDIFNPISTFVGFTPCIERGTDTETVLDDAPVNIIKKGKYKKLPMLFGFDDMEGVLSISNLDSWKDKMNKNFSEFLPMDLQFENKQEKEKVANAVRHYYFGDKLIDESNIMGFVNFFSDIKFIYPTLLAVKLHAQAGHDQLYLYEYSFVDEDSPSVPYTDIRGANHCDQTAHVNGVKYMYKHKVNISKEYANTCKTLQELWHNFITTGKPVPEGSSLPRWPAAGVDRSPHMSLGVKVELRDSLMKERTLFWDEIYDQYYRPPVAPPAPPPRHSEL